MMVKAIYKCRLCGANIISLAEFGSVEEAESNAPRSRAHICKTGAAVGVAELRGVIKESGQEEINHGKETKV